MSTDFTNPFSAFTSGVSNMASYAIGQHYEARDLAIERLVEMHYDDFNITDPKILKSVLKMYGLSSNGFCSEASSILQEAKRRVGID